MMKLIRSTSEFHEHSDAELLRAFTKAREDDAFRELVGRHAGMVQATALRITGQVPLAEEVSQNVFVLLASKAPSLQVTETLGPWLHRVTVLQAKSVMRKEVRKLRVLHAFANQQHDAETMDERAWDEALPVLDEAIQALSAQERQLVIMRYFERLNYRDAGLALGGKSADAVRMQLQRALQRLCEFLRRRGVALSVTALINLLGTASPAQANSALIDSCARAGLRAARVTVPGGKFPGMTRWQMAAGAGLFTLGFGIMQTIPQQPAKEMGSHVGNITAGPAKPLGVARDPITTVAPDTALSRFLSLLDMVEDEYQHPDLLAEAISLIGQLSEADFPIVWEKVRERVGKDFKTGRMARSLCTVFFSRWAELAPTNAFTAAMTLNDERTSAMVVFETWVKLDRKAAEAAVPRVFETARFAGHAGAWKRIARSDPEFGLRLRLMVPDDGEKEVDFWQFMQWHSFMRSHGYALALPGTEVNFMIVDGSATHPNFSNGDANSPGPEKTILAMKSMPAFDVRTLTGSLLYVEAAHRGRTPENAEVLLDELLKHLPISANELATIIQWVREEPLLSEGIRQQILQHPALTRP